jgi:signal transduction histidine kinase
VTFTDASSSVLSNRKQAVVFLRWVMIVGTSYLLLFGSKDSGGSAAVPIFVAAFLASNLALAALPEAWFDRLWMQGALVVADTAFVSGGIALGGEASSDLYLLYFSVLFLAALAQNLAMIAWGAFLTAAVYLFVLLRSAETLLDPALLLRFPFLFAVATFYGYLVEAVKLERQRAEAIAEHERFRSDLLASLTHDLQSPLSAIAGFAALLLEAPPQAPMGEYRRMFEAVQRGANECGELVASFLALVRGEARLGQGRRQTVDLNSVVAEVCQLHEGAARAKDLTVSLRLREGLPPVSGDRLQLRRAVANLFGNAVKFARPGGRVEVSTECEPSAVTLSVADDGPGIAPQVLPHLFERYVRGEGSEAGTGLGLFVVRLVAEAHGGSVAADSEPGRGSRFTLRLPLPADAPLLRVRVPSVEREAPIAAPRWARQDAS